MVDRSSPQQDFDASKQFRHLERFGDVIVGPKFEREYFGGGLALRSEKENGSCQPCLADIATDIKPTSVRQPNAENNQVEGRCRRLLKSFRAVVGGFDDIPFAAKPQS